MMHFDQWIPEVKPNGDTFFRVDRSPDVPPRRFTRAPLPKKRTVRERLSDAWFAFKYGISDD